MAHPKLIGVLGGMGPEATILFQRKMLEQVAAQDDTDHIPLLIDMNPQVPSRISYLLEKAGQDPGRELARMAHRLQCGGAEALVMPCNTAHFFAKEILDVVDIPLLNLVDLAADHAFRLLGRNGKVGLLASPAVFQTRLYGSALEKRGLTAIWPKSIDATLKPIRAIKAGENQIAARHELAQVSRELSETGAEVQIIACSEFSIIADCIAPNARAFDSLDVLAKAAAKHSLT